ncbi:similar to Saccharomyces cerevisiae YEL013W VAC8 Phosphorylated and palmitoylated vacuolar membrane protein that interacts with Atg13p [Maudiozyma barnettii]|uniref:Vacuolar protein 8 n=1 Tax=Maudiozyma barnettii TaxID=61262 RepID=A0A8H2VCL8_9SACH|nr:protein anchor VAC8 [Kazachstania barnettii]CAB4252768.1 similar to Saccharomyces cerevisiae YEL013W VAC8 Phosphorylated and palmitoylated vacuolar membrane protein that interacts with Atg13p [Kazachstania barnettii]CAD1780558.1 similar to Saccharomyces cerevisiae YEL013W VAC8 Phosphorylated and palmitoylated vacuolar membrane protein that interacts with Atg13p [Kazachstania barnettii]
MGACCSCMRDTSSAGSANGGSANGMNPQDDTSILPIADNEREAVTSLLGYLEDKDNLDFYSGGPLKALTTLVYSDNLNLQRSAALAFAEITEKYVKPVSRDVLEPILILLQSNDPQIQIAACAALGNLAVNNDNKLLIVEMGGLEPLIHEMMGNNVEVQCNAVGCITNLATRDDNKHKIATSGALVPLTRLAKSKHIRVQRNATGALLNMTHSHENRKELVNAGAVPVLVSLLSSADPDVQYYCTTALSNIAVDEENREKLSQTEPRLVSKLVALMDSTSSRVKCQATLALRNLASDPSYQLEIVRAGGLPHLVKLIQSDSIPLILASVACIRNISIHPLNEGLIVDAGFLKPLVKLLDYRDSEEIQCHAVSTLRNLAASSEKNRKEFFESGAIEKCKELALSSPISVQSEISACFAILALADVSKLDLLNANILDALIPMTFSQNQEVSGNSAAALANLCSRINNYNKIIDYWNEPKGGIRDFLSRFLKSDYATFEHIALWTILQLLESHNVKVVDLVKNDEQLISGVKRMAEITSERVQKSGINVNGNEDNSNNNNNNNNSTGQHGDNDSRNSEPAEDASLELYNITQQILEFLK